MVLIGSQTASRHWVKYEIQRAYELNKGIVGVYIHEMEDRYGSQSTKGVNPFDKIKTYNGTQKRLRIGMVSRHQGLLTMSL